MVEVQQLSWKVHDERRPATEKLYFQAPEEAGAAARPSALEQCWVVEAGVGVARCEWPGCLHAEAVGAGARHHAPCLRSFDGEVVEEARHRSAPLCDAAGEVVARPQNPRHLVLFEAVAVGVGLSPGSILPRPLATPLGGAEAVVGHQLQKLGVAAAAEGRLENGVVVVAVAAMCLAVESHQEQDHVQGVLRIAD